MTCDWLSLQTLKRRVSSHWPASGNLLEAINQTLELQKQTEAELCRFLLPHVSNYISEHHSGGPGGSHRTRRSRSHLDAGAAFQAPECLTDLQASSAFTLTSSFMTFCLLCFDYCGFYCLLTGGSFGLPWPTSVTVQINRDDWKRSGTS